MTNLPSGWTEQGHLLTRTFEFKNFLEAVAFVNKIAAVAEEAQHHPDLEIFSYRNVRVKTSTHDAGNIVTQKDMDLAEKINAL